MSLTDVHPSHVVVFGVVGTTEERAATADAIGSTAGHATRICLRLDCDGIGERYPDVVSRVRAAYDRVGSVGAGYDEYCASEPTDEAVAALRDLLAIETWHLAVFVQHVRLEHDGDAFLLYNADHRQFDVDGDAVPAAIESIESALEGITAGILPAGTRCEWECNGRVYELSPPSFCVETACFDLAALRGVDADAETRTIRLEWDDSRPSNRVLSGLVGLLERLGPSRPTELRFDSRESFREERAGFESVSSALTS
ncbi:hypothetical protein [Natronoglomus mannanivorans]|uniref:Uncharacterized protein n=1 Tax=Natronoglomus mannanivorans TaxID=2979990 RepID=A0AAP2YYM2_9EURY|nr:hypothetical protein [Halobacteria archaeon AArc-xg1-1]